MAVVFTGKWQWFSPALKYHFTVLPPYHLIFKDGRPPKPIRIIPFRLPHYLALTDLKN